MPKQSVLATAVTLVGLILAFAIMGEYISIRDHVLAEALLAKYGHEEGMAPRVDSRLLLPLSADDVVFVPKGLSAIEFVTPSGFALTWYPGMGLVSWKGSLFAVYYDDTELLAGCAWFTRSDASKGVLRIEGIPFRVYRNAYGNLQFDSVRSISRTSGMPVKITAHMQCVSVRPPKQWVMASFDENLQLMRTEQDSLTPSLKRVQRWIRRVFSPVCLQKMLTRTMAVMMSSHIRLGSDLGRLPEDILRHVITPQIESGNARGETTAVCIFPGMIC